MLSDTAVRYAAGRWRPSPNPPDPPLPIRESVLSLATLSSAGWPLWAGGLVRPAWQVLVPLGAGEVAAGGKAGHGLPVGRVEVEHDRSAVCAGGAESEAVRRGAGFQEEGCVAGDAQRFANRQKRGGVPQVDLGRAGGLVVDRGAGV